jgi:hypothetical protein
MKDKDLEVVENLIRILQKCYLLNIKNMDFKEARKVAEDIKICKIELNNIKKRKAANDQLIDV